MGVQIKHIEYIFPDNCFTNEALSEKYPDYDFSKFDTKVGIKRRYWVNEDQTALDLAVLACEKLFKKFDRNVVDYVIYCTQSPEYILPTTACILQDKLSLRKNIGAFDYNLGCSGYIYGLSLAKGLLESKQAKNVLLVTAETYSKYINKEDMSNLGIFGDAATATIVSFDDENQGVKEFLFGTNGAGFDKLIIKNGATKFPFGIKPEEKFYGSGNKYTDNHLYMDGPAIFNFTSDVIPSFTFDLLKENDLTVEDCDLILYHQANKFMLEFMRKKLKVDKEKFYIDLEDGGNTVSCTIPIALKKWSDAKIESEFPYLNIALVGFGVGLSWAGTLINLYNRV